MKIKTKMLLGGGCLAALPVLIGCFFLGQSALYAANTAIEENAKQSLIAARDLTAAEIVNYFGGIEKQALSLSENLMTVKAMQVFSSSFNAHSVNRSEVDIESQLINLRNFYNEQFNNRFKTLNDGENVDVASLLTPLDKQSISLQYDFISNNIHPLGSKQLLNSTDEPTTYSSAHAKYHDVFRNYIERFGYYDLFLVDYNSGDIVYSVFKELDYATSLRNGPYADSGIGQAFKLSAEANEKHFTGLTDFAPYLPSYNAPASFISSPIYSEYGEKVGVLILQMPIDKINAVMTYGGEWKESGFGESGETFIVGQDFKMRSNSRFIIEDKANYIELMKQLGTPEATVSQMMAKGTTIGLQEVKTKGVNAAFSGEAGFDFYPDYRGIDVLSAYKPIDILGIQMAIVSEIDQQEAFLPIVSLKKTVTGLTALVVACAVILGPLGAWLLGVSILKPVKKIANSIDELAKGDGDLTQRMDDSGNDEISDLSRSLNVFLNDLDGTFSNVIKSAMRLVPMSDDLSSINKSLTTASTQQNSQIIKVKERLLDASEATQQVNNASQLISEVSKNAEGSVDEGVRVFNMTFQEIKTLENIIDNASISIDSLKAESDSIVKVIDVINAIADQTNLLALNAAIEAARAGEAGRGFSVVADEVRALASRTQEATLEVSSMVTGIQSRTSTVVSAMELGKVSTEKCGVGVNDAKHKLTLINEAMNQINERVVGISSAALSQKDNFEKVASNFNILDDLFSKSKDTNELAEQIGVDMSKMSNKLRSMVEHFELSDNNWSVKPRKMMRSEEVK